MNIERIGSYYGGHTVITDDLTDDSVVYSCGIGDDASFDLGVMEYGCQVYAFDPTPRSIEWVMRQDWPEQFNFYPWGIAGEDGPRDFYAPSNLKHISFSTIKRPTDVLVIDMKSIDTIADELGHDKIDVLKLDVEGAEYEIIDNLPSVPIKQIVVEFHHFFHNVDVSATEEAAEKLVRHGYKIFSVAKYNWGFIKC